MGEKTNLPPEVPPIPSGTAAVESPDKKVSEEAPQAPLERPPETVDKTAVDKTAVEASVTQLKNTAEMQGNVSQNVTDALHRYYLAEERNPDVLEKQLQSLEPLIRNGQVLLIGHFLAQRLDDRFVGLGETPNEKSPRHLSDLLNNRGLLNVTEDRQKEAREVQNSPNFVLRQKFTKFLIQIVQKLSQENDPEKIKTFLTTALAAFPTTVSAIRKSSDADSFAEHIRGNLLVPFEHFALGTGNPTEDSARQKFFSAFFDEEIKALLKQEYERVSGLSGTLEMVGEMTGFDFGKFLKDLLQHFYKAIDSFAFLTGGAFGTMNDKISQQEKNANRGRVNPHTLDQIKKQNGLQLPKNEQLTQLAIGQEVSFAAKALGLPPDFGSLSLLDFYVTLKQDLGYEARDHKTNIADLPKGTVLFTLSGDYMKDGVNFAHFYIVTEQGNPPRVQYLPPSADDERAQTVSVRNGLLTPQEVPTYEPGKFYGAILPKIRSGSPDKPSA